MSFERKRIFIAVNFFPDNSFNRLYDNVRGRMQDEKIRWVKTENLHITLRFIGEFETSKIPVVSRSLSLISKEAGRFNLIYRGLGVFKNISNPKVLWIGTDKNDCLKNLKYSVDTALEKEGLKFRKERFSPHLTIGRIKFIKNKDKLNELMEDYRENVFHKQCVESIELLESRQMRNGVFYSTVSRHLLKGAD